MDVGGKRIRTEYDGIDRITELPVHLREHILDCLSIKEAVATSVLSSKWRYCWAGLRKLIFDCEFWDFDGWPTWLDHLVRARAVDRVFMLHRGPIHEFLLSIPKINCMTVDINMWLHVLSNSHVQWIHIDAFEYPDNSFPIPSCLFHCRELKYLCLGFCKLTLPSEFKGFPKLKNLVLEKVDIASSSLERLITGCELLETLNIQEMFFENPLAVEALNLKTFYLDDCALEKIIFKDVPKLTRVTLVAICHAYKIGTPQSYNTLAKLFSFYKIEQFTFDFHFLPPLSENFPGVSRPLENLKSLTMRSIDIYVSADILFMLYLMRSAPYLQNLTIELDTKFGLYVQSKRLQEVAAKLLKSEAKKHTSCNSIRTIKVVGIKGLRHEILLIKLLKKRCPKSKSICIKQFWRDILNELHT